MKKLIFIFIIFVMILLNACSTSNYFIKPNTSLNGYKYVLITPPGYNPYNADVILSELFYKEGFQVVNNNQTRNFNSSQVGQILFAIIDKANYGMTADFSFSVFNAKQELIYQGSGTYDGINFSNTKDMKGAANNAFSNFAQLYTGFDENFSVDPVVEFKEKFKN